MPPPNRPTLTRTRSLRRESTDAERLLWRHLRNRGLTGAKFRRQEPVGRYIVDFICPDRGLVVEVDGGQHAVQAARDQVRDRYLASRGYTVLRFWNPDVLGNIEGVLTEILNTLARVPPKTPSPAPQAWENQAPPPGLSRGEGPEAPASGG